LNKKGTKVLYKVSDMRIAKSYLMYILGVNGGVRSNNQDASACLLKDGKLIAAVEEERFLRIKFANGVLLSPVC